MNMENKMPHDIYEKLFWIRVKSKLGDKLEQSEFDFCSECYKKYSKDYAEMNDRVFEEAAKHINPLYRR